MGVAAHLGCSKLSAWKPLQRPLVTQGKNLQIAASEAVSRCPAFGLWRRDAAGIALVYGGHAALFGRLGSDPLSTNPFRVLRQKGNRF